MYVVIAYDIVKNKRRRRVRKILETRIPRVQKSVFEGEIEEREYRGLIDEMLEEMDLTEDNFRVYRLCGRCRQSKEAHGVGLRVSEEEQDYIL